MLECMRILAIVNNFPWPGNIDGILNLRQICALRDAGHAVRVIRCVPFAPPFRERWRTYSSVPAAYTIEGISVRTLRGFMPPRS